MIVEGKNLFPLQFLESRLRGYFVDAQGQFYSNRGGKALAKLAGSKSSSWTPRYYTLDGASWQEANLLTRARGHAQYAVETTSPVIAQIAAANPTAVRNHATSVETGIVGRGSIIGSVQNGKLSFSANPVIHMTDASLKAEMHRLATASPGTKYISLQITNSVVAGGVSWA